MKLFLSVLTCLLLGCCFNNVFAQSCASAKKAEPVKASCLGVQTNFFASITDFSDYDKSTASNNKSNVAEDCDVTQCLPCPVDCCPKSCLTKSSSASVMANCAPKSTKTATACGSNTQLARLEE